MRIIAKIVVLGQNPAPLINEGGENAVQLKLQIQNLYKRRNT